jgi:hypothetical protein
MICNKCLLTQEFPGTQFSSDGVCNHCRSFEEKEDNLPYETQFIELIGSIKSKRPYDCMLAFSGGKDSTYTLYLLKHKYKLNVLTYTFDNGFISKQAKENIKHVTEQLDSDNITFSPIFDLLKKMFRSAITNKNLYSKAALMRASAICTTCINFIRYHSLKCAIEKNIPIIVFGWAPGQIDQRSIFIKPHYSFLAKTQESYIKAHKDFLSMCQDRYFLSAESFKEHADNMPYFVNPLLFNNYEMNEVKRVIQSIGWKSPQDIDANSTNCLLNTLGNKIHINHFGYNPYMQEVSELVRDGFISREEGVLRMENNLNEAVISYCEEKLELNSEYT